MLQGTVPSGGCPLGRGQHELAWSDKSLAAEGSL